MIAPTSRSLGIKFLTPVFGILCFLRLISAAPIERELPAAAPSSVNPQPKEVVDAIKRFDGGNPEGAYELLKDASAKHPELAPPRVMYANLFFSDHQRSAGLQQLEQATVDYPEDPEPHLIFGDIALAERRLSDANVQYATGRTLLSKFAGAPGRKTDLNARCFLGLARVAMMHGHWDTAQKLLKILLETQPLNATVHQRLAETFVAADKEDDALDELQKAVKADPHLPTAASQMAEIHRQLGRPKDVEKWLTRAVKETPKDVRARLAMGQWWLDDGELAKAAAEFTAAEAIEPRSADVKLSLGAVARYQNNSKSAQRYLQDVLEQSPSSFAANDQLALLLAEQSDPEKLSQALKIATENLHGAPKSAAAESTLGWIYYKLGKLDDAERHLRAAGSLGKISRDTAYFIARLMADRGRRDESAPLLRQAVSGRGPFVHEDDAKKLLAESMKSVEAPRK